MGICSNIKQKANSNILLPEDQDLLSVAIWPFFNNLKSVFRPKIPTLIQNKSMVTEA